MMCSHTVLNKEKWKEINKQKTKQERLELKINSRNVRYWHDFENIIIYKIYITYRGVICEVLHVDICRMAASMYNKLIQKTCVWYLRFKFSFHMHTT